MDGLGFVQGLTPTHLDRAIVRGNFCSPPRLQRQQVSRARALNAASTGIRCTATWRIVDVEAEQDKKLFDLETKLVEAVEAESFAEASTLRDEIAHLQSPTLFDVLQAHMRFYRAFETGMVSDMARMWAQDEVTCIHPDGRLRVGYINVVDSFGHLFASGMPKVKAENVRISLRGRTAYVTCDEIVTPDAEPGAVRMDFQELNPNFSNTPAQITMQCINIFVRKNGEYLLTHRSSSFRSPLSS